MVEANSRATSLWPKYKQINEKKNNKRRLKWQTILYKLIVVPFCGVRSLSRRQQWRRSRNVMRYKWSCDRTTVGWVPHCNGPRGCRCGVQGQGCDSPSREGLGSKLPLQVGLLWFAAEARDLSVLRSVQTASGAHRPFYSMRPDALSPGYGGRGVKLTTHIQLLPRSGMEAYLLSPLYLRVMHTDNILCQFGPNNLISI